MFRTILKWLFLGIPGAGLAGEPREVMTTPARGVNWMNEEWVKAKKEAELQYIREYEEERRKAIQLFNAKRDQ